MKFRKTDNVDDTAVILLAYMKDMDDKQRARIQAILERITTCEGRIPGKLWCDDCRANWQKIWSVAIKFRAENQRRKEYVDPNDLAPEADMGNTTDTFRPYEKGDTV